MWKRVLVYPIEHGRQVEYFSVFDNCIFVCLYSPAWYTVSMFEVTEAEIQAYIAEAEATFPHLPTLEATLKLAMQEARAACAKLLPYRSHATLQRKNRDEQ